MRKTLRNLSLLGTIILASGCRETNTDSVRLTGVIEEERVNPHNRYGALVRTQKGIILAEEATPFARFYDEKYNVGDKITIRKSLFADTYSIEGGFQ